MTAFSRYIVFIALVASAQFLAAPETAQAFGPSFRFLKNRARAPFWPAPKKDPTSNDSRCTGIGDNAFRACYFNGTDFNEFRSQRDVARIDFDWRQGSPDSHVNSDQFSARFTGSFDFGSGATTFTVVSDDGVRLWIDDQRVIDEWSVHAAESHSVTRNLSRGKHKIELEYFEDRGGAILQLSWNGSTGDTGGGSTPGCVNGRLQDPKAYFFSLIGRAEGSPANDWETVLNNSPIPTAPNANIRPDGNALYGLTQQRNSSGLVRGRLFLPTDTPDSYGYYLHPIDVLEGSAGNFRWAWKDWIGGPAYSPQPCR